MPPRPRLKVSLTVSVCVMTTDMPSKRSGYGGVGKGSVTLVGATVAWVGTERHCVSVVSWVWFWNSATVPATRT